MWDLYANGPAAVAIRSTIGKLKRVLVNSPGPVHIGRVGYLDWATTNTWPNSLFGMLVRGKGHAYRHEQEVRLTFWIEEVGWQDYLPKETASRPIVLDRLAEIIGEILAAGLPFPSESETEIRNLASRAVQAWIEQTELRRMDSGNHLDLDHELLFDAVVLGPNQDGWLTLVQKLMKRYGLAQEVRRSALALGR